MREHAGSAVTMEVGDGVAEITFTNGPLNLLTRELRDRLATLVRSAGRDPNVRVVLLTGGGTRAFSVGSDVRELHRDQSRRWENTRWSETGWICRGGRRSSSAEREGSARRSFDA